MDDDTTSVEKTKTAVCLIRIFLAVKDELIRRSIKGRMPAGQGVLAYQYVAEENGADIIVLSNPSDLGNCEYSEDVFYLFLSASDYKKEISPAPQRFVQVKLSGLNKAAKEAIVGARNRKTVAPCAEKSVVVQARLPEDKNEVVVEKPVSPVVVVESFESSDASVVVDTKPVEQPAASVVVDTKPVEPPSTISDTVVIPEVQESQIVAPAVKVKRVARRKKDGAVKTTADPPPLTSLRILVVDGNKDNRESAERQLRRLKIRVASGYDEAKRILTEEAKFNIVIASLSFPAATVAAEDDFEYGRPVAYGLLLALEAVGRGAKIVVVDIDPHQCMDSLSRLILGLYPGRQIVIGDTKIIFTKLADENGVRHWGQILAQVLGIK